MKRSPALAVAAGTLATLTLVGGGAVAYAQAPTPDAPTSTEAGPGHGRHGKLLEAAATALGMTKDELKTELTAGKTVAQVAEARGVDVATVIAALTDAANAAIDQAVADGKITEEQAAARSAGAAERITNFVNNGRSTEGGRGGERGPGKRFGDPLQIAATALNLSKDDLRTRLVDGVTIAQVAQEQGVDPNVVVTALTDAANTAIDQAVTDGRLTAEQADAAKAKAAEHATRIVNEGPRRHGGLRRTR